ncbi:MAG: pyridoxamine 5'-phosphate oxidase family protein [Candidatus Bathyarchaeia archaeon]
MATADTSRKPNVIYVEMWWWEDLERMVVVDNYLNKTRHNLEVNPKVTLVAWDREHSKSFQIKCSSEIQEKGPLYMKGYETARERKHPFACKVVVVLHIEAVYKASAGDDAGERIL